MGKCGRINFAIVNEIVSAEPSLQKVDRDSDMAPDSIAYIHTQEKFLQRIIYNQR